MRSDRGAAGAVHPNGSPLRIAVEHSGSVHAARLLRPHLSGDIFDRFITMALAELAGPEVAAPGAIQDGLPQVLRFGAVRLAMRMIDEDQPQFRLQRCGQRRTLRRWSRLFGSCRCTHPSLFRSAHHRRLLQRL